jgi:hypothetical protein
MREATGKREWIRLRNSVRYPLTLATETTAVTAPGKTRLPWAVAASSRLLCRALSMARETNTSGPGTPFVDHFSEMPTFQRIGGLEGVCQDQSA